jgi:hypothetical protein
LAANQTGTVLDSPASGGGWTETVIYTFGPAGKGDGQFPASGLTFDAQGNMFGTTVGGGATHEGTRYELSPSSSRGAETILHNFPSSRNDGASPQTGVLLGKTQSHLYGSTMTGGSDGSIYRLWFNKGHRAEKRMRDNGGEQPEAIWRWIATSIFMAQPITQARMRRARCRKMHYRPNQTHKFRLLYSFGTSGSGNGGFPQSGIIVNGTISGTTGLEEATAMVLFFP